MVTPALISAWLSALGLSALEILFVNFWYSTLNVGDLCSVGPPALPPPDTSTLDASLATIGQYLKAIAWTHLCQCVPGAPAPQPYQPPDWTSPTGWPSLPTVSCSNADLCATVTQIAQGLIALQNAMASTNQLVTLLQRYSLPFAFVLGPLHAGLTGTGSLTMPRLLGVKMELTAQNIGHPSLPGNPEYLWNQGWVSWDTPDGMLQELRVTRAEQVWLPRGAQLGGSFKWKLDAGVSMDLTELIAET